ncbi:Bacterial Pleckstrin homology domain [Phytophthora cactorum]|nr:Bacterial Pleckstrin homology domain [Phytophthora cactorum]
MGNTNSAIKGLASDIAGTTGICDVVADVSSAWAASYLLPNEEILYVLQSVRQEFAFTNRALIKVSAETSTTTRKLVERIEYKNHRVEHVRFESTGVVDRDCELEFKIGEEKFKIDIERSKEEEIKGFYKALVLLDISKRKMNSSGNWSRRPWPRQKTPYVSRMLIDRV